ncbi:MAG: ABC transporter permease, partial [Bacteroidota bacterium]
MNLFILSWKNLIAKPLSAGMSLLLLALGVSIISLLLLLNERLESNFLRNLQGIDMVVGAKGSPLQLILASVYHIDNPTGNIPLSEAESLMKHPLVKKAIPLAYGDNYQGYRILGTDTSYLSHYEVQLSEGRVWDEPFEVVIGGKVAERMGLEVGSEFFSAHGLTDANDVHDSHPFTVVGILESNGTVADPDSWNQRVMQAAFHYFVAHVLGGEKPGDEYFEQLNADNV